MTAGWWAEELTEVYPTGGNLVLTPGTPEVETTNHLWAYPTSGELVLTPGTPTLDFGILPPSGVLTLTAGTPIVQIVPAVAYNAADAGTATTLTNGSMNFPFTAATGADVFVAVIADRSGSGLVSVTYGGVAMTQIAALSPNNTSANGMLWVYRLGAAGNGASQSVVVTAAGTNSWYRASAISATNVIAMGSVVTAFGSGTTASQSVTVPSGIGIQIVGAASGGGGTTDYTTFSGVTNRVHPLSSSMAMALNTVAATGTASSTSSSSQPWAAVYIPLT